jgi:hypothetical protein
MVHKTYGGRTEEAAKFCPHCSRPAPWVSREERIRSISDRLLEEPGLGEAKILELREMLKRLAEVSPDDDRQIAAWREVQEWAPTVWNASKPVLQDFPFEAVIFLTRRLSARKLLRGRESGLDQPGEALLTAGESNTARLA